VAAMMGHLGAYLSTAGACIARGGRPGVTRPSRSSSPLGVIHLGLNADSPFDLAAGFLGAENGG
jgi:hypothetical protein